jgi:hypothetical protein
MPIELRSVIPIVRIFSVGKAREFCVDFLGWVDPFDNGTTFGEPAAKPSA